MNSRSPKINPGIKILAALSLLFFATSCVQSGNGAVNPPPADKKIEPQSIEHQVNYSGETLALIAAWYTGKGTNWTAIRDANPGVRPERIAIGQRIIIPGHLVTERSPMPRKFINDNWSKTTKSGTSAKPSEDAKTTPPPDSIKVSPPEDEEIKAVEKKGSPKEEINLDDLLGNDQVTPPANNPSAKPPAADDTPAKAEVPAAVQEKASEKSDKGKAPATGDAEREQLLDELLTQ